MSLNNWLSRIGDTTKRDYGYTFNRFEMWKLENGGKFKDTTPDQLIEYQRNCTNKDCFEILDMVQRWILSMKGLAYKSKKIYYLTILSFFQHNRAELPKDKTFKIRGDKPKTPSNLRPNHIREAVLIANPMYGAMITCMLSGGMGVAEVIEWSNNEWENLKAQLDKGSDIIKIELQGRKHLTNIRPFFTLIGGDALNLLRQYLGPDFAPDREAIFLNPQGKPVKKTALHKFWLSHLKRIGIVKKVEGGTRGTRYGYGLHELRENFRTLWSISRANPDIGEFLMGHQIDEYGYNQVYRDYDYVVEEYRKALPYLDILSGGYSPERNEKIKNLEETVKDLVKQNIELKAFQTLESNASMRIAKALEDMSPGNLDKFLSILESLKK